MLDSSPIAAYIEDDRRDKGRNAVAQHEIIADALQQGRTLLTEIEAKQVLQELGIATAMGQLATSEAEAVQAAEAIGFPVVLKISSAEIVHKSDGGGYSSICKRRMRCGRRIGTSCRGWRSANPTRVSKA